MPRGLLGFFFFPPLFLVVLLNCSRHNLILPATFAFRSQRKTGSSVLPLERDNTFFFLFEPDVEPATADCSCRKGANRCLTAGGVIKMILVIFRNVSNPLSINPLIYRALNHIHGLFKALFTIKSENNWSLQSQREATVAGKNSPSALTAGINK